MSEKNLKATPKRREDARKKGQVLKSAELVTAIMQLGYIGVLKYWFPIMLTKLQSIFLYVWGLPHDWTVLSVANLMSTLVWLGIQVIWPVFATGIILAITANYLQVHSLFTLETIKPQLSRISILKGAKRMFGVRAWVDLGKSLLKVTIIGYFLYAKIRDNITVFSAMHQLNVGQGVMLLGDMLIDLAWSIALAFVFIAVLDFLYQWWDFEKNLKMSHEEMKQEYKQTEGNPQLKAEIKRKQRAIAMRRMMQDLKTADVVITNPTHFAVAVRYDPNISVTPYVVAKGADELALHIRRIAKEYDIIIMENRPLARALYAQAEIGQSIPLNLYKAVAEVLAFVYRLKKKKHVVNNTFKSKEV